MRYKYSFYKDISKQMDYLMIGYDSRKDQLRFCDRLDLSYFNQLRFIHICSECMIHCLMFHISHMPCLEKVIIDKRCFKSWGDESCPSSFCIKDCPVLTVLQIDSYSFSMYMKYEFSGHIFLIVTQSFLYWNE